MEPVIAYVGDDFTGSTDVMEVLQWAGLRTVLFLEVPTTAELNKFPGVRAVGVASCARALTPEEMERELQPIFQGLVALSPKYLHYKTCSTGDSSPRIGSIGKAIDIGRAVCNSKTVPVLIAAPRLGRYQVFGNLFATSGEPSKLYRLDRHPTMRYHPITPMYEADMRAHLKLQTSATIDLVDCLQLDDPTCQGWNAESDILLMDALTEHHLTSIGKYCDALAREHTPALIVGSSGMESSLVSYWEQSGQIDALRSCPANQPKAEPAEQMLVLSGSCSPVNERQILWAKQAGFEACDIEPALLVDPETHDQEFSRVIDAAVKVLSDKRSLILHTALGPADRRRNQLMNAYAKLGLGQEQIQIENSRRLGPLLGKLVKEILQRHAVPRLGISGGDTSSYVVRELGIVALEAIASLAPGVPLCRAHAKGALDGIEMIFKGGQVGNEKLWSTAAMRPVKV